MIELDIKPFQSLGNGIDAIKFAFKFPQKLKFEIDDRFSTYERDKIVKMLSACKGFITLEQYFNEYIKFGNHIKYHHKFFWNDTSWEVSFADWGKLMNVYSGCFHGEFWENPVSGNDQRPYISSRMKNQLLIVLRNAKSKWSEEKFKWVYEREVRLISKAPSINIYTPGDEYGIYSGRYTG